MIFFVVKEAAIIMLEDIHSQVYETKHYPLADNFLQDIKTIVLESLNVFLKEKVIVSKKVNFHKKWKTKCITHAIISAARFRSFINVFLECINYIMAGNRLKELLITIYTSISIDKMMMGHYAYTRALRAHILTHLAKIVLQMIDFTEEKRSNDSR